MVNIRQRLREAQDSPDREATSPKWERPFETLREKWTEVPTDFVRVRVSQLLQLEDRELLRVWEQMREAALTGEQFGRRGWYHMLYEPLLRGARLIDLGSGLGMDGLSFAAGAESVTFVDVASENLALLKRIAGLKRLNNVSFILVEHFESLRSLGSVYDVILASGSLHNAPQHVIKREVAELAPRLKIGGRWLQLAYPKERWERDGRPAFSKWGEYTDGKAPWVEWYDLPKLLSMFEPLRFEPLMAFTYRDYEFNWFDLVRRT